jgi:hypothetical protein
MAHCLTEHFSVAAERWGRSQGHPPNRLVYLLDHEYTPRGLSWTRLKGADGSRCDLLRAAADRAGCEVVLALAEVRETHEAYPADEYYGRGRYGRYRDWEEDNEGDDDGEYEVQDLLSSEVELTRWLAPDGKRPEDVSLSIDDYEACASTPSGSLKPYSSQYEGNMGNYGNTLDRWYKRGALVVWPREQAFANRAETSPRWAMEELSSQARSGDVHAARAAAQTLSIFWDQAARAQENAQAAAPELFPRALQAAIDLEGAETAEALVRPFRVESLRPSDATAIAKLTASYGRPWMHGLLAAWYGDSRSSAHAQGREEWLITLPALCGSLHATGTDGTAAARQVSSLAWAWLRAQAAGWLGHERRSQREKFLADLGAPLAAILDAAALAGPPELVDEITDFALKQPDEVIPLLLATLRAAAARPPISAPDDARKDRGFADIAGGCAERLRALQRRPQRASDDWSIQAPPGGCTCELCGTLKTFLADRARRTFEWRLRTDGRQHVHTRIDSAELPVTHITRRTGSPYTLVLTKTERLFAAEREARATDAASLQWLAASWS